MQNKNPEMYPPKPEGGRHGGGQMPHSGVWPGGDPIGFWATLRNTELDKRFIIGI